jgi:hypothetical protein
MNTNRSIARPCHVPQDPSADPREHVRAVLEHFVEELAELLERFLAERTGAALLRAEEGLRRVLAMAVGHLLAGLLQSLHRDRGFVALCSALARATDPRPLRHRGLRETLVRFTGGACLRLTTPYLSTDREGLPGRRRGVGRRGAAGGGCHPVLEALGVRDQATPALASEVARQSVRCSSFEEAAEALRERGLEMDAKAVRTLTLAVGDACLRQRDLRRQAAADGQGFSDEFAGKRIVVSVDGGRLRTRRPRGGRKGRRGRRRYETPWREPKLLTVYVVDEQGRKRRCERPLYDGTLGDADEVFGILVAELLLRGAARAELIVVTGDGAHWIWNRVQMLAEALGVEPGRIVPVADFYHAVEHLTATADLVAGWTDTDRKSWVRDMRRRLKAGKVDEVVNATRGLCRGRRAKAVATQAAYFEERRELMRYDRFKAMGIPRGSGAVESAVRRVVNLRLKGAGIFWHEGSAEAMLHLRAYLKAGRWDEVVGRAVSRSPDGPPRLPLAVAA